MIYFTSDQHLGHKNIIRLQNRPFKSLDEMNNVLINNINETVGVDDELYILGDFSFYDRDLAIAARQRLICPKIYFIYGNHDKSFENMNKNDFPWEWAKDYYRFYAENRHFVLFHYPIVSWHGRYRDAIHLHGHCHHYKKYNLENRKNETLRYDVGVDANDFKPVSMKQILNFFDGVCNNPNVARVEEEK